jgi:hypothetical protein
MGADLYRKYNKGERVPILGFERSLRAINSGYFRDAYNSGSILQKFGLSWWVDIGKLQDKEGVISLAGVKKFRAMLKDEVLEENIKAFGVGDQKHYRAGAKLLKKYLDDTITQKDSIEASL